MNGHVITIELILLHSNMYRVTVVDCDHGYKPEGMEDLSGYDKAISTPSISKANLVILLD